MFGIMPVTHNLDPLLTGNENESAGCCSKHSKTTSVNSVQNVYLCTGKKRLAFHRLTLKCDDDDELMLNVLRCHLTY